MSAAAERVCHLYTAPFKCACGSKERPLRTHADLSRVTCGGCLATAEQDGRDVSAVAEFDQLAATIKELGVTAGSVIDAIEETFLPHLPSKAISYCAQEDVWAGLDAMRERFGVTADD